MPKTLQHRRGTTSELSSVTGAAGEIFYDTTKDTLVVMDGSTAGGYPLEKEGAGTGATGPQGAAGATGSQGPQGASGVSGGGGGGTGDYTFTNNVISLPDYTDAELNLVGLQTRNVPIYRKTYTGTYSGAGYSLPATGVFEAHLQNFEWLSGKNVLLTLLNTTPQILIDSVNNWQAGDTFDLVYADSSSAPSPFDLIKTTVTLASAPVLRSGYTTLWDFTILENEPINYGGAAAIDNYPYETNAAYNLKANGQFIAQEAIIGETLIANDIITPLALDSYGLVDSTATGTLTVNGNLDVLGAVYVDSNKTFLGDTKYQQREALFSDTGTYYDNIGIGRDALKNAVTPATGNYDVVSYLNTAIGVEALESLTTGKDNVAIGSIALKSTTTGYFNVSVGNGSLRFCTTGTNNTAIGHGALANLVTSGTNTALGGGAGSSLGQSSAVGDGNTFVGNSSGNNKKGGDYNTYIGYLTRAHASSESTTGSNNTLIGYQATQSSTTVSNEITLGNSSIETLRCQVTSITALSDARDKKDIETLGAGLDFVSKLKPVSFNWNMRDGAKVDVADTGFIAQDLKQVQEETGITIPGLVYESNPEKLEASYGKLIPVLVKAIQDLQAEVEALKSK